MYKLLYTIIPFLQNSKKRQNYNAIKQVIVCLGLVREGAADCKLEQGNFGG